MAHAPGHQQADHARRTSTARSTSAFSQGWRRVKLYFLTGLPTETDEDTLGIAELARNVRRDRPQLPRRARRSRSSVGGFVPKPFTPFQWFGQNTVAELQRKVGLLRDATCAATAGVQLKWHDPKATLVEGLASRGDRRLGAGDRGRVAAAAARSRSGREHFDLDAVDRRHGRATASSIDWYVHRHRTEDEVLPWDHLSAGLHKDFLWQDWRTPSPRSGSRTAGGRPATTAARAPATASSTSSPRPTPPAGGSQGTGQDLDVGGRGAGRCCADGRRRAGVTGSGSGSPSWARSASPATATSPACGSGRCAGPSCRGLHRGFSPRPKLHFGLALSTGHESLGEYLDVDLTDARRPARRRRAARAGSTRCLPVGFDVARRRP